VVIRVDSDFATPAASVGLDAKHSLTATSIDFRRSATVGRMDFMLRTTASRRTTPMASTHVFLERLRLRLLSNPVLPAIWRHRPTSFHRKRAVSARSRLYVASGPKRHQAAAGFPVAPRSAASSDVTHLVKMQGTNEERISSPSPGEWNFQQWPAPGTFAPVPQSLRVQAVPCSLSERIGARLWTLLISSSWASRSTKRLRSAFGIGANMRLCARSMAGSICLSRRLRAVVIRSYLIRLSA
jgi:hypothetical protein